MAKQTTIPWADLTAEVLEDMKATLQTALAKAKPQSINAFAFHGWYAEANGKVSFPALSANTVQNVADKADTGWLADEEWPHAYLDYHAKTNTRKWESELSTAGSEKSGKAWEKFFDTFMKAMVDVGKQLGEWCKAQPWAAKDFIAVLDPSMDDDAYGKYAKKMMSKADRERIWGEDDPEKKQIEKLKAMPSGQLTELLIKEFLDDDSYALDTYVETEKLYEILASHGGEEALKAVSALLKQDVPPMEIMWFLREVNHAMPEVTPLLRQAFLRTGCSHTGSAITARRDVQWLSQIAISNECGRSSAAVEAILGSLTLHSHEWAHPVPLDYGPVTFLLEQEHLPDIKAEIERTLSPKGLHGSSTVIHAGDVSAAVAGTTSKHKCIRFHAARGLWNLFIEPKDRPQVIAALTAFLRSETDPAMIETGAQSLLSWGSKGFAVLGELLQDPHYPAKSKAAIQKRCDNNEEFEKWQRKNGLSDATRPSPGARPNRPNRS